MSKKIYLLSFFLFILLIIVGGIFIFNHDEQNPNAISENQLTVFNVTFSVPQGYIQGKSNEMGSVNITNGSHQVFVSKKPDNNVERYVSGYAGYANPTTTENYTVDNITVYKIVGQNPNNVHYWFVKGKNTYEFYTWDGNKDIEDIINYFIKA